MPPAPAAPVETVADASAGLALAERAAERLAARDIDEAVRLARRAAEAASDELQPWLVLAAALEAQGDVSSAVHVWNAITTFAPGAPDPLLAMARIALRTNAAPAAEDLFTQLIAADHATAEVHAGVGAAQAAQLNFAGAHATLRAALEADPGAPELWVALADLLCAEGRQAQSLVFFEEALRIGPRSAAALEGLADALLASGGDAEQALALSAEAIEAAGPQQAGPTRARHGRRLLAQGRLAEGWDATMAGVDPDLREDLWVRLAAARWTPDAAPNGRLLLMGENDTAEEILLTAAVAEVAGDLPLILAVGPSWLELARRSFPAAYVVPRLARPRWSDREEAADLDSPHLHEGELLGAWAPLRQMSQSRRASPAAFGQPRAWLTADPARTADWRSRIAQQGAGLAVGLCWRLASDDPKRGWANPPPQSLGRPLSARGVRLVALHQAGSMAETEWMQVTVGRPIRSTPEVRPSDFDELAALAGALDLVIGPPCAETFVAAACGVETWFLATPGHWAMLGSGAFPWFPNARAFLADGPGDWDAALDDLGKALSARARG